MKKFFVGLFLALSVAGLLGAEQKFSSLPIGYNLDGYINSIQILIVGDGLDASAWQSYPYSRTYDGKLETFAAQKLREYTASIQPSDGTSLYGWAINAITDGIGGLLPTYNGESKPATIAVAPPIGEDDGFRFTLRNGKWEVPEEVFGKVRFDFGISVGFYIPTVTDIEVNLYNGTRISRFSTIERISDADNPCELPAILAAVRSGWAVGLPSTLLKPNEGDWWSRAEITLYEGNKQVTFIQSNPSSPDDGKAIRWSTPFPSVFVLPTPKIASLKRVGAVTEMTVEGAPNATVSVEWKPMLGLEWEPVSYLSPLSLNTSGSGTFSHTTASASGFYRLRLAEQTPK